MLAPFLFHPLTLSRPFDGGNTLGAPFDSLPPAEGQCPLPGVREPLHLQPALGYEPAAPACISKFGLSAWLLERGILSFPDTWCPGWSQLSFCAFVNEGAVESPQLTATQRPGGSGSAWSLFTCIISLDSHCKPEKEGP